LNPKIIPLFIRHRIESRPNLLKIIDNIGWLFFDKILRMGVGLVLGVWIARYLGPEQFGLFNFSTAFIGLFGAIAGLGLKDIVVRDIVRDPGSKEETLGTAAVLQFIGGLIAYGLILGTIFWLRPDDTLVKALVAILGSMMLFKASEVGVYWFESQVLSKYAVLAQNGSFLVFAAIKIGLILNNAPLTAFAWATMAEALMVALLLGVLLGLRGPRLHHLRITLERAKSLLKDSWPLMLSGIAIVIYMKIDQIMLGQIVGDEAVGIYSAAVRVSEVWYFVPVMIAASVFPAILEAKKRSEAQYYQRLQRLFDLMVWLSVIIALPMTFLSAPIVTLIFGEAYASSGPVLAIHIWTGVFAFLGVAAGKWFLAENLQTLSLQRSVLGAGLNVLLNLFLIPYFGVVGAAVATIISHGFAVFFLDFMQAETRKIFYLKVNSINIISSLGRVKYFKSRY